MAIRIQNFFRSCWERLTREMRVRIFESNVGIEAGRDADVGVSEELLVDGKAGALLRAPYLLAQSGAARYLADCSTNTTPRHSDCLTVHTKRPAQ